jgi:hypothetical protein
MTLWRFAAVMSTFGLFFVGTLSSLPRASAQPPSEAMRVRPQVSPGLWVVGVDEEVAGRAGYSVRRLAGGRFQLVPNGSVKGLSKQPVIDPAAGQNQRKSEAGGKSRSPKRASAAAYESDMGLEVGNCGTHFTYVQQTAPHKVTVTSGFSLNESKGKAYDIDWKVRLRDANGTSYQSAGQTPSTPVRNWQTAWYQLNQYGHSYVNVHAAGSVVFTTKGYICWGHGAYAFITIH